MFGEVGSSVTFAEESEAASLQIYLTEINVIGFFQSKVVFLWLGERDVEISRFGEVVVESEMFVHETSEKPWEKQLKGQSA